MAADDWPTWVIALAGGSIPTAAAAAVLAANVVVADRRLARWATAASIVVAWKQRRWVRCGPFAAARWGGRVVYRLRLKRPDGTVEFGWATSATGLSRGRQPVQYRADESGGFPVVIESPRSE